MKRDYFWHYLLSYLFPYLVKDLPSVAQPGHAPAQQVVSTTKPASGLALPKTTDAMLQMETFLERTYDFRFNQLTEETEYRKKKGPKNGFAPIGQRELNSFCIAARKEGIDCWDRDISRYVCSDSIPEYHPIRMYMHELPVWDGTDRVKLLALRV